MTTCGIPTEATGLEGLNPARGECRVVLLDAANINQLNDPAFFIALD